MKFPTTLSLYVGRKFLLATLLVLAVISVIILLSSGLEIIRTSYGKDVSSKFIVQIIILKLPFLLQKVIPFVVLIAGIITFSDLNKSSELIVARAAGISAWQFLIPALLTSFILGVFIITLFNPVSAILLEQQEKLVHKYLRGATSLVSVSSGGLWLRENNHNINAIIHAKSLYQKEMVLYEAMFLLLDNENKFQERIDAKKAQLNEGYWLIDNAIILKAGKFAEHHHEYKLPTKIKINQLQDSFASPETISFWELPGFIRLLKLAGFSASKHSLHLYHLIIQPIFLCAMVLIAASFSLKPIRYGKSGLLIVSGIISGFIIYFVTDLVSALGLSGNINIGLAATLPVLISILIGITLVLHQEDG